MTSKELDTLYRDIFDFFNVRKTQRVPVSAATRHFKSIGYELTRPIEHTLQVYGVVERPKNLQVHWPEHLPPISDAWKLEDDTLVPSGT